jgi:ATP-dependent Clp protease ATP-binding subunit ClpC
VRTQVARIVGSGDEVTPGQIPFTPRAKKVLELSLREARSLDHNYIGTEHILLGLVRENEGVAARILLDFGVDADTVRNATIDLLAGRAPQKSSQAQARRVIAHGRSRGVPLLVTGALIFAVALGVGIAIGRLIWG